jgi:hypothetical protein
MTPNRPPGLYEELVTRRLEAALDEIGIESDCGTILFVRVYECTSAECRVYECTSAECTSVRVPGQKIQTFLIRSRQASDSFAVQLVEKFREFVVRRSPFRA